MSAPLYGGSIGDDTNTTAADLTPNLAEIYQGPSTTTYSQSRKVSAHGL